MDPPTVERHKVKVRNTKVVLHVERKAKYYVTNIIIIMLGLVRMLPQSHPRGSAGGWHVIIWVGGGVGSPFVINTHPLVCGCEQVFLCFSAFVIPVVDLHGDSFKDRSLCSRMLLDPTIVMWLKPACV